MKWIILLPINIVLKIVNIFFAWLIVLFNKNVYGPLDNGNSMGYGPRLPNCLYWFQTVDNSLEGDYAWRTMHEGHWPWRSKISWWPWLQGYIGTIGWLWRNPAQGFERSYAAAKINPVDIVNSYGNPFIKDKPNGKHGYCFTIIGQYWGVYAIIPLWQGRCMKVKLGWNLKTYAENPARVVTQPLASYVCSVTFPSFVA